MTRIRFVPLALAGTVIATGVVLAQRENAPGMPTIARVQVLNREPADAIGVTIHDTTVTIPVEGTVNVSTAANATVATRESRQAWEYRQLNAPAGQDVVELLNKAGIEGWEAMGTVPAAANSLSLILKRPR